MGYHADRFADASLLVLESGRLLAALPANRVGDEVVSHGGLTFGGVLAPASMSANRMLRSFDALLERLRSDGVRRLVYKPAPRVYQAVPAEDDLYALFRLGARLVGRDLSSAVPLDRPLDYAKGRRSSVKRAAASGLAVNRETAFEEFIELEASVLERHGVTPTHTGAELALLAERFPDNIKLFTVRRDRVLLAGVVVYETAVLAHTQYIAASEEGKRLGAADLILDGLIRGYAGTLRFLDFGISTERLGEYLNVGLVRNKESYGGRPVVYDRYLLEL